MPYYIYIMQSEIDRGSILKVGGLFLLGIDFSEPEKEKLYISNSS